MRICIFSLYKSENLGEMVYTECLRKLLTNKIPDIEIDLIDIHGRDADTSFKDDLLTLILKKLGLSSIEKRLKFRREDHFLRKYYTRKVKGAKAVIIPGGGYIKCTPKSKNDRAYRYNEYFNIMSKVCAKENIGLYYNAVGHTINGNEENEINAWRKTFSQHAVKYVSCRDELPFFKSVYDNAELVCCTAAYSAQLYHLYRDVKSNTVGIGLIRPDAFRDYGCNISDQELIDFYTGLIESLSKHGFEVKLFTNGLSRDYDFGKKIEKYSGKQGILLNRPTSVEELLTTISMFKGVIVSRMHAAIIAYSFDIPAVCLCWNNKHLGFLSNAGVPERAIFPEDFEAEHVMTIFLDSIETGWPINQKNSYRATALTSVDKIVNNILENN